MKREMADLEAQMKLLKLEEFSNKYEVSMDVLYMRKHKGDKYFHIVDKHIYIDEEFILKRIEFRKKIKLQAQENYFFLTACLEQRSVARLVEKYMGATINSWNCFMETSLFRIDDIVLQYKISTQLWDFYKCSKALINSIFKVIGVKNRDYDKLYNYKYKK